jgi:hypothetical protein
VTRREKEQIVLKIYKKYYPEKFANYKEIIKEKLKSDLELDFTDRFDFLNTKK